MRYIVIGLGRFGFKLASVLTEMGHEVIGIDRNKARCEDVKDNIGTVLRMDCTNVGAVSTLPLHDVDVIVVAIGGDVGSSILTLSILKNLNVKRIIGRAINEIHQRILSQIGIDEIVHPLEDSAVQVAGMLQLRNVFKIMEISSEFSIAEVLVPQKYSGHTLDTMNLEKRFNMKVTAIKRISPKVSRTGNNSKNCEIILFFSEGEKVTSTDILVVAGKVSDIKKFIES